MADSNDVSLSDSQLSSDSGVQTNDSNVESQLTESRIMAGVTSQSTPTSVKKENNNDIMSIMLSQFEKMNSNFETKFNVMNSRFDTNDVKFDVLNNSLCSIESRMNEICSEVKRAADELREYVCTEKNKITDNYSDKCKNTMPDKESMNNNDVVANNENSNNVIVHLICLIRFNLLILIKYD